MKLSVVILNYDVRYFLELCLKSVQESLSAIDAEIIVIDNNSSDDSCNMVKQFFPEVILIENQENAGFAKANNQAVQHAQGEFVCILNPDTVISEDTFIKLIKFAETKEKIGIVGCRLINGKGHFLPESKRNVPYIRIAVKKLFGNSKYYYANHLGEKETGKVDILVGAFMFMRRELYNGINGFDEDYFMYAEDIDISYKVLKAGYNNYYFGDTTIVHYKGESTLKDKSYAKQFYAAMQIFYRKHFNRNMLFDVLVGFGLKLAYINRTVPDTDEVKVDRYILMSESLDSGLKNALSKEITLKRSLEDVQKNTEIIFDANTLSYKDIIAKMSLMDINKLATFKILPKNASYVIGSNDAIHQGEVILFKPNKVDKTATDYMIFN